MDMIHHTSPTRRATAWLLAASLLPVVVFVLLRQFGLLSLARLGVIGLIALAGAVAIFTRPKIGIFFMIVYVYAGLSIYLPGAAAAGVMALMLSAVLLELVRGGHVWVTDTVFLSALTILALIMMTSMLWANNIGIGMYAFTIFAKAAILVLLIVQLIRTADDLRAYGMWIFLGAIAAIFLGLANIRLGVAQDITVTGGGLMRFAGTQANPNYGAALMLSGVPIGVFFVKHSRNLFFKIAAGAGTFLLIAGVFATFSRAALIALAVAGLGVVAREIKSPKIGVTAIALLVLGALATPKYYWVRLQSVINISEAVREDWSFYLRFIAAREAWELFLEHPITGLGLSNFRLASARDVFVRAGPHNMYLELLADLGLLGLFSYLGVHYSAFRQMIAGSREQWQRGYEWLGDFSYYLMLTLLSALVAGAFMDCEYTYLIWIPLAGGVALANIRKRYRVES
jgi:O-antigen ligase